MCLIPLIHSCVRRGRRGFLERRPRSNLVDGLHFMLEKQPKLLVQDIIERRSNVYYTIQARRQAYQAECLRKAREIRLGNICLLQTSSSLAPARKSCDDRAGKRD